MTKAPNQTENMAIKKEEEDIKDTQPLHSVNSAKRNSSKITKRKPSKRNSRRLPVQQIKVEEDTDSKPLLQISQEASRLPNGQSFSQEQINQFIDYVANDKMAIIRAARKVKIGYKTALRYYNLYKNDPEKKIPSVRNQFMRTTQEQIENFIKHIVDDKMTVIQASAKENMSYISGKHYYKRYLEDPNHNIPMPYSVRRYTQDQKNALIGYIINGKMSITAASKKAKMNAGVGYDYYHQYFDDQNPDIATPSHIISSKRHTQKQINEVISYIVGDKMTVSAASKKANMSQQAANNHYRQYLKDNNMELPVSKCYTQDEINKVVGYIVDDKMSIRAASNKVNMALSTGYKYYRQYRKGHNIKTRTRRYTQEKINEVIGYIVDDKMTITAASKKASISSSTGSRHYRQYLNDQKL